MKQFEGRVAVITGAGSGIGRALANALAAKGCELALVDSDSQSLNIAREELALSKTKVSQYVLDVTDRQAMQALPSRVQEQHGAVHLLINNAGVAAAGTLEEQRYEDIDWVFGVNFWGVLHGCKAFLPLLKTATEAHIVNVSSMLGFLGTSRRSAYCASKAAVSALSESLAAELAPTHVGVTCAYPGMVQTNIVKASRATDRGRLDRAQNRMDRKGLSPEFAARKIIRAIEGNKRRVLIGKETVAAYTIKRLFPGVAERFVAWEYLKQTRRGRV